MPDNIFGRAGFAQTFFVDFNRAVELVAARMLLRVLRDTDSWGMEHGERGRRLVTHREIFRHMIGVVEAELKTLGAQAE